MTPPSKLVGGRRIRKGTEVHRELLSKHGRQGIIYKTQFQIHNASGTRKRTVELAEKEYRVGNEFPELETTAIHDYGRYAQLKQILPRDIFLPTVRMKLGEQKAPTLVMTLLGQKGQTVLDLKNAGMLVQLRRARDRTWIKEKFPSVKNWNELIRKIREVTVIGKKHGWEILLESFTVEIDPKTGMGRVYIVDLGSIRRT